MILWNFKFIKILFLITLLKQKFKSFKVGLWKVHILPAVDNCLNNLNSTIQRY